jgi:hypothetical protein
MDIDMTDAAAFLLSNSYCRSKTNSESEAEVSQQLYPQPSSSSICDPESDALLTPPPDDNPFLTGLHSQTPPPTETLPPLPPTPVALSAEEKTALLVARLKAEAAASVQQASSDEDIELRDLSDDENEMDFPSIAKLR